MYRRFVLLLDVEMRFDCAGSQKVRCRLLSASVSRGMYRRFVLLLDVEMRFDCAGSQKVRCRLLSASVSRGIYRRFLLLLDVEVRFYCAGSHKLDLFAFWQLQGPWGFCLAVRWHGFPAKGPGLDSRPVLRFCRLTDMCCSWTCWPCLCAFFLLGAACVSTPTHVSSSL